MKLNEPIKILAALIILPSLLFAQEGEFIEDRSNSVVEIVDSDHKRSETTESIVKDNVVKKSDIVDSLNAKRLFLGAHLGGLLALTLHMTMIDEFREYFQGADATNSIGVNFQEPDATWIGVNARVGAVLGFYFNRQMALVSGLDYQMLYYKMKSAVFPELLDHSITYHLISVPLSFRYHF